MKLSIAVQTSEVQSVVPVALLSGTFEEKLAKAASLGADGVELMCVEPRTLDADGIRSTLMRNGLEVSAVGSGAIGFATGLTLLHADPTKTEQARARLGQLIDFAAAVGAPLVTVGSFRGRLSAVGNGAREQLITVLRGAATKADSCGVRLALEPLNRYETDIIHNAEEGLTFLSQVNHFALGLLLDTYHVNIEERSWTEPLRRVMAAGQLWHVHLGDSNQGLLRFMIRAP